MEKYLEKAKILTKFFGVYGYGNFDLSDEEVAKILELLELKKDFGHLEVNLQEFYERLEKIRMG